jgi:hypothetical protein
MKRPFAFLSFVQELRAITSLLDNPGRFVVRRVRNPPYERVWFDVLKIQYSRGCGSAD